MNLLRKILLIATASLLRGEADASTLRSTLESASSATPEAYLHSTPESVSSATPEAILPNSISVQTLKATASEETDNATMLPSDSIPAQTDLQSTSPIKPKVNPVDIDREKPEQPVLHYYDKHGNPLETPVRFLAELDTITKIKSGPKYPSFSGVSVGANFFDAVMMIVGQQRASFDIWADCSIHNWFFPVIEAGIGFSNAHPQDGRFNFKVAPSFYTKVGMNYNFLYKSNPDYQVFLGLRAGMSAFNYDIHNISAGADYYVEGGPTDVNGLHATHFFGEALAGIKVKIYKAFSLGWTIRYGFFISQRYSNPDYPAWFTPGKGSSTPISATFSAIFTFGAPKKDKE